MVNILDLLNLHMKCWTFHFQIFRFLKYLCIYVQLFDLFLILLSRMKCQVTGTHSSPITRVSEATAPPPPCQRWQILLTPVSRYQEELSTLMFTITVGNGSTQCSTLDQVHIKSFLNMETKDVSTCCRTVIIYQHALGMRLTGFVHAEDHYWENIGGGLGYFSGNHKVYKSIALGITMNLCL